ncbi:hypothetical protein ACJIZ3_021332 [Penstemon smallii]|uniref:Uncharacterized protein n=1 Tax=Penstemon smallii TaxID=265156 RepID=A0ABD3SLT8_9LAMI
MYVFSLLLFLSLSLTLSLALSYRLIHNKFFYVEDPVEKDYGLTSESIFKEAVLVVLASYLHKFMKMLSTDTICEEGQDSTFFNTIYLQGCLGRRWELMSIVRSRRYGSLSPFYLFLGNLLCNLLSWKVNYNVSLLLLFHKLCTFVINV